MIFWALLANRCNNHTGLTQKFWGYSLFGALPHVKPVTQMIRVMSRGYLMPNNLHLNKLGGMTVKCQGNAFVVGILLEILQHRMLIKQERTWEKETQSVDSHCRKKVSFSNLIYGLLMFNVSTALQNYPFQRTGKSDFNKVGRMLDFVKFGIRFTLFQNLRSTTLWAISIRRQTALMILFCSGIVNRHKKILMVCQGQAQISACKL